MRNGPAVESPVVEWRTAHGNVTGLAALGNGRRGIDKARLEEQPMARRFD